MAEEGFEQWLKDDVGASSDCFKKLISYGCTSISMLKACTESDIEDIANDAKLEKIDKLKLKVMIKKMNGSPSRKGVTFKVNINMKPDVDEDNSSKPKRSKSKRSRSRTKDKLSKPDRPKKRRSKTMTPTIRTAPSADKLKLSRSKSNKKITTPMTPPSSTSIATNYSNDTKANKSSKKRTSKPRKQRPKTAKSGATNTFFGSNSMSTPSTPVIGIESSSSVIGFVDVAEDCNILKPAKPAKERLSINNLKKSMSQLDNSSIQTRKEIGDAFKLFKSALIEQEKLLNNNLAKVHKRKRQWIDNHMQWIKENKKNRNSAKKNGPGMDFIQLNPLIELDLDQKSILHQISLFGSVDMIIPNDVTSGDDAVVDEEENEIISESMKQKMRLSKLQNATMDKLNQIIRMEQEARQKSADAIRLQKEAEEDMRIMKLRFDECEAQLAVAKPELDRAMEAVSSIEKSALNEIKALKQPPKIIEKAMTATALMLGHTIKKWGDVQKILSYKFVPSIMNYDTEKLLCMNVANRDRVKKKYLSDEDFTFERVNVGSKVCGALVIWIRSQIRYSEMLDIVIPMRREIRKLKKESKRKTKLAKQLIEAVGKLKINIELYRKECSEIIEHIIVKTDEELKNFGDKLEPLNAKFHSILKEIDC